MLAFLHLDRNGTTPQGRRTLPFRKRNYVLYTLWLFNIAMGSGPFIDGLPIKNGDFPWLC